MPLQRGKGLLALFFLRPLLPPAPATFVAPVPSGAVRLQYRESLGYSTLLRGAFEEAEVRAQAALAHRGLTAVDAGASVGIFSVALGCAVGVEGYVLAFEPVETNFARLRANIAGNGLSNVEIFRVALGAGPASRSSSPCSAKNDGTDVEIVPCHSTKSGLIVGGHHCLSSRSTPKAPRSTCSWARTGRLRRHSPLYWQRPTALRSSRLSNASSNHLDTRSGSPGLSSLELPVHRREEDVPMSASGQRMRSMPRNSWPTRCTSVRAMV